MSPTKRPFQPTFFALVANRSMKRMSCGLPQLRLRDGRMTCQVGPVIGSDTAPARQPSKSPPIERGGPGNGVDLRANSSLAGVDGASGFFSGGSGSGWSEPGSIGSIKCFSCATAELAAARRTASRQTTARISNYTPYESQPGSQRMSAATSAGCQVVIQALTEGPNHALRTFRQRMNCHQADAAQQDARRAKGESSWLWS